MWLCCCLSSKVHTNTYCIHSSYLNRIEKKECAMHECDLFCFVYNLICCLFWRVRHFPPALQRKRRKSEERTNIPCDHNVSVHRLLLLLDLLFFFFVHHKLLAIIVIINIFYRCSNIVCSVPNALQSQWEIVKCFPSTHYLFALSLNFARIFFLLTNIDRRKIVKHILELL